MINLGVTIVNTQDHDLQVEVWALPDPRLFLISDQTLVQDLGIEFKHTVSGTYFVIQRPDQLSWLKLRYDPVCYLALLVVVPAHVTVAL